MFFIWKNYHHKTSSLEKIARNWNGGPNGYTRNCTKVYWSKVKIIEEALRLNIPIHATWSCYTENEKPCGLCDSCRIRDEAFINLGRRDLCSNYQ